MGIETAEGQLSRRHALAGAVVVAATSAAPASQSTVASDPHPALDRTLTRIAFGSCANQNKDQPIWDKIVAARPDLFVFLGDNIYGDTRDMNVLRAEYAKLAAKPGFANLRATTPLVAIWDDHDYGENDSGSDYPLARDSQHAFLEFFGEPADSPRWWRDGLYASYVFGPAGRRVQVIMPDLRIHRSAIRVRDLGGQNYGEWARSLSAAGKPVAGPYERNPDRAASMMSEAQWTWFSEQLRVPADVRLIASSIQVLADFSGWEAWANFAADHDRLIDVIRRSGATGVVFLSGDTHYGEISRLDVNVPYPLWDVTSSGLTEVWDSLPENANRVGQALRERNFGMIEIAWDGADTELSLQVRDGDGMTRIRERAILRDLQPYIS